MASTSSAREARRKKIAERGSDRLAFISGHIQTLSPSSSSSSPSQSLFSDPHLQQSDLQHHSSIENDPSPSPSRSTLPAEPGFTEITRFQDPPKTTFDAVEAEPVRSLVTEVTESRPVSGLGTQKRGLFAPKQISAALVATEKARLACSVVFSVFVVLSYVGIPLLGTVFRSVIRPLYLVLVTNATVVISELQKKQRDSGRVDRGESRNGSTEGTDFTEQIGKTLEIGLLIQKITDAVFMDCAVYAVIVVCGVSFAQKFC